MNGDELVAGIFENVRHVKAESAYGRMYALIRAGQIAQAYTAADSALIESVFGLSSGGVLQDNISHGEIAGCGR